MSKVQGRFSFLCASSVFSVPLWWVLTELRVNHRDTENTEVAQRIST